MATDLEWARAYKAQARADMAGARALADSNAPQSVRVMLLQMTMEKLAKAALLASGSISLSRARSSHKASVSLVQQLIHNKRACRVLGWERRTVRIKILPLIEELEAAQPQSGEENKDAPVLEYPWESPTGEIQWPEAHLPIVRRMRQPGGRWGFSLSIHRSALSEI